MDQTDFVRHTVLCDHGSCHLRCLFDILGCSGRHIAKDQLFCNASPKVHDDILQHFLFAVEHLIFTRKRHRITGCPHSGRDHGDRMDRSHIRQHMEQDRMTCLVVSGDLLFFLADDPTLFLLADADFDEGTADIFLHDIGTFCLCRIDCCLIHQVFQICPGKSCGCSGNLFEIYVLSKRLVFDMDCQDLFSSAYIRSSDADLAVETSRS